MRAVARLVVALAALAAATPSPAQTTIKLATLVPDGSVWHQGLKQMGSEWRAKTSGRVTLNIYAGGTQGDELATIKKMQFDQLQAASLTALGLWRIDPAFNVFSIPLFYQSPEELFHVMEKLTPALSARLEQKGFVLLGWGHAGWVHVFSRIRIDTLDDLKKARLFTSAGPDDRMAQWYKAQGFTPVQLAVGDMMVQLKAGKLDAVPATPLSALAFQWFGDLPFMLDAGLSPLAGANIITKKAWDKLSADDRAAMVASAQALQKRIQAEVPKQDAQAVVEMEKRGLKRVPVKGTPNAAAFEAAAKKYADSMRGEWIPPDIFDLAVKERDAYRQQRGAK